MIIHRCENLPLLDSLSKNNCFSSLPVSFGFTGKRNITNFQEYQFLKQIHSSEIFQAQNDNGIREADGLFTLEPNQKIAVRTADCLPLLLTDQKGSFVMVLHAGWRGLAAGIIAKAITIIKDKLQAPPKDLAILMGPCLSQDSFEVGPEVIEAFTKDFSKFMSPEVFSSCYKPGKKDRSYFCLRSYAFYTLRSFGVFTQRINAYNQCTSQQNNLWYSYRKEAPLSAHNWSWISKQP